MAIFASALLLFYKFHLSNVNVLFGVENTLCPSLQKISPILIEKGNEKKIVQKIELPIDVEAPVEKGQAIGRIILTLNDETVGEYTLTSEKEIRRMSMTDAIKNILGAFRNKNS